MVKIIDGPFADFEGSVDDVNQEKGKVRVLVQHLRPRDPGRTRLLAGRAAQLRCRPAGLPSGSQGAIALELGRTTRSRPLYCAWRRVATPRPLAQRRAAPAAR